MSVLHRKSVSVYPISQFLHQLETQLYMVNQHSTFLISLKMSVGRLCVYTTVPINNTSMPPRYRRAMVKVLVKRACEGL